MSYTKLFHRIITSSIWDEPHPTRIVWITMMAMANQDGYVGTTKKSLALLSRVSEEECDAAIKTFLSPDPESRTKEHSGRRIEVVDGGWCLLNFSKHRDSLSEDPNAVASRERMRRMRIRESQEGRVTGVMLRNPVSVYVSSSVSPEGESEGKPESVPEKSSLETYLAEEQAAYSALTKDAEWISEQQRYYPNMDILLSLEKAHNHFWGTEAGWKHKSRKRTKVNNWKLTYANALSLPGNKVWRPTTSPAQRKTATSRMPVFV